MNGLVQRLNSQDQKINQLATSINSIMQILNDYKMTDDVEENEKKLDKKRRQLYQPLFTDSILPEFSFNPSFVTLFIKEQKVYRVRGIRNDYSEDVDVDIPIEFPITLEEGLTQGTMYLRRMQKNKYAYISGTYTIDV